MVTVAAEATAVIRRADRAAAAWVRGQARPFRGRPSRTRCRAACIRRRRMWHLARAAGARRAAHRITSSSCALLIGHPRSSKSTGTWALIGVESRQRADVLGRGVDDARVLPTSAKFAQRLDPAGGRAGADRDQRARLLAHLVDALGIVQVRDASLDDRDV